VKTALVAVVVALLVSVGTAGAARVLITSKDIKNGTIQLVDLSGKAKRSLKGQRGPRGQATQGPPGPQGAQGPAGAKGEKGDKATRATKGTRATRAIRGSAPSARFISRINRTTGAPTQTGKKYGRS
jgi:hypothetical protein